MQNRLDAVLTAIDDANAADPNHDESEKGSTVPATLLYGHRMSSELERLFGAEIADTLKIAARGQHIERWVIQRSTYPEGRAGYLAWRRDQGRSHGERLGELMRNAEYPDEDCERVGVLLRKEGLRRDPEVQMLEDTICMVFLKWYFADFAAKHPFDKVVNIVAKTSKKLSESARSRVLREFDLPDELADAVRAA